MNLIRWLLSKRPKPPEALFSVELTSADEVICRPPNRPETRIPIADLGAVYVETNDSGPWGMDVWWVLLDKTEKLGVAYPLGAEGEDDVLARLQSLPGFEVKGMDSTKNARFLCWQAPSS